MSYYIDFEPLGRRGECQRDHSLLETARHLGVDLLSLCGGQGICRQCVIQVLAGRVSEPTTADRENFSPKELAAGYRLACMTYPLSDCKVGVPAESLSTLMRTQVEGLEVRTELAPAVRTFTLELQPPTLSHPQADADNLLNQLNQAYDLGAQSIDLATLQELSPRLRAWKWHCRAHLRRREVIAVSPAHASSLGVAIDLGSTKIAGYLVDLETGQTLAVKGVMNPQISYGEDIISRCAYAGKSPLNSQQMQRVVVETLNQMVTDLCTQAGVTSQEIVEAVIVGNTAMHHLLLKLPTAQLVAAPFVPAITAAMEIKAREIGLALAPGAYIYLLPNVAGFVGADHIAMLLATQEGWTQRNVIALDIGTNTEISLITATGQMSCLSCASGPAFEGYHIKDGTRARPGAIEKVKISAGQVYYQTIENIPPSGICGSGILDAVAQLQLAGLIEESGRLYPGSHPRLRQTGIQREFLLVEAEPREDRQEMVITQNDIREIQLAKAAIQTGIQVLLAEHGLTATELDQVIIAGAFGSYIDLANAVAIGMLPTLPLDRFKQVGNAAGAGARLALLSTRRRVEAQALFSRLNYIELAQYPKFSSLFARNCRLKPYNS